MSKASHVNRTVLFIASLLAASILTDYLASIRLANLEKRLNANHALVFEANQGQVSEKYCFLARDRFGVFLLGPRELVYGGGRDAVRLVFEGSNPAPEISGRDLQPGRVNYLLGQDAARWIRGIRSYARVQVAQLYPGIDAVYYGSDGSLETDFIVEPRTNPGALRLRIEGHGKPSLTPAGDLKVRTSGGLFQLRRPSVYQQTGKTRRQIACRYVLSGRNEISFAISGYDTSQPLVIDPVLSYSSYLGGGNSTAVRAAVDSQGNAYLAGATTSPNYPVTPGAAPSPAAGAYNDVLVTKFSSQGSMVYSTHVGGSQDDIGLGIAVDSHGQAYVTGSTSSPDFPTHAAAQPAYHGAGDGFVFALNAAGSGFVYSTYLGGTALDAGTAIAVDAAGNAYVAGATDSTNFPTVNPLQGSLKGGSGGSAQSFFRLGDVFVTKLSPAGAIVYSTYYGGSNDEAPLAIAVDSSGSPYVAGFTTSTDFPLKSPLQPKYGGAGSNSQITTGDAFVFKLTPDGSQAVYSTYLGGSADDVACGIAVDSSGNAYLAGSTFSANFPLANAMQGSYGGQGSSNYFRMSSGDGFVAKINPSGSALVFSTYLGGKDDDRAFAVAVDGGGNVHVAGNTASANFPVTSDAAQHSLGGVGAVDLVNLLPGGYLKVPVGFGDAFYTRLSPTGSLTYSTYLGGSDDDVASGLAVDSSGNAYLSGNTASANFPLAGSSYQKQLGAIVAQDSSGRQVTSLLFGDAFLAIFSSGNTGPVTGSIVSIANAASFTSALAPGSVAAIFGSNLGTSASAGALVGGQTAQVLLAGATQWNVVIPYNAATGASTIQVGTSPAFPITLSQYAPALVSVDGSGQGNVAAERALIGGTPSVTASAPALPGDILYIFATGLGAIDANGHPNPLPTATLGGQPVTVLSAAAQSGAPGTYQVTIQLPTSTAAGTPALVLSIGGAASQSLALPVGTFPTSGPVITNAENGASFLPGFSPGSWTTITGANLSGTTRTWTSADFNGSNLPTQLDQVSVTIDGKPAYVYYISPTQINVLAPADTAQGSVSVQVAYAGKPSNVVNVSEASLTPALFMFSPLGQKYVAAVRYPDGQYIGPANLYSGLTVPAKAGDTLLLFGTGFGPTNPTTDFSQTFSGAPPTANTVTATIGGVAATVGFAGLVYPGEYQFNLVVPGVPSGDNLVVLKINGVTSQANAYLNVQ
jgi:uncharacterized protein (TIGR03437 family)